MTSSPAVTRFAPSPTGELHLGNARTAFFNALLARRHGGRFLLRIEDTDAARSTAAHAAQLQQDLRWLGLSWDGEPMYQSQRAEIYRAKLAMLEEGGRAYPCFCTPQELQLARAAQSAAGRPPRYSGKCRELARPERSRRIRAGEPHSMRFAVPREGSTGFTDLVHGPRQFAHAEIGDFVLLRTDGSAAFFFSNAIDDALSGVTHLLRGDDHLSNTPRQLLILRSLALLAPEYGHLALLTGGDGVPLSKRNGAVSLRELREEGWHPLAILNYLFRLGHSTTSNGFLTIEAMASCFDVRHLQRSPAHFERSQLQVWQKEALRSMDAEAARDWMDARIPAGVPAIRRDAFIAAVLPNLVLPGDALPWVEVAFGDDPGLDAEAAVVVQATSRALFAAAAAAAEENDFRAIAAASRLATGLKGADLFKPLRAALTGKLAGPELAPLLQAMAPGTARRRLARFA